MASMKTSFQDGVSTLYDECVDCGVTPSAKTPAAIIAAIKNIFNNRYNAGVSATKKGNATAGNVLSGKTFTSASAGVNVSGTMANRGALNWNPSGSESKTVSAGYYSGGTLSTANAYNAGFNAGATSLSVTDISSKLSAYASQNHGFRSSESLAGYKYIVVCATYQSGKTASFSSFSGCSCLKQISWTANGATTTYPVSVHLVILTNVTGAINVSASSTGTGNVSVRAFGFK